MFLAGANIEAPGEFADKADCIEAGKAQVEKFKEHHPHSTAWFWCVEGRKA